jgi:autotransporter-associated beta strand protein
MQKLNSSRRTSRQAARQSLVRMALAASSGLGAVSLLSRSASATSYTYTNPAGGLWSVGGNWAGGVSPVSDPNNQILFNTDGTYTAPVDIVAANGPFSLNSLTVSLPTSTSAVTLGLNPATIDTLTFATDSNNDVPSLSLTSGSLNIQNATVWGDNSNIVNSGSGNLILGYGLQGSQTFGNNVTISNTGNGLVQLVDFYPATTNYNSTGANNTLTLANPGGGTFEIGNLNEGITGTINISGGAVIFSGSTSGNLFGNNVILNVLAGASFNFENNGETMGGISGAGNIIMGTAGITCTENGNRSYTGVISGTGALSQSNTGSLTLGGQNNYSGATTVTNNGTLNLMIANAIAPSSAVAVNAGNINLNGYSQIFNNFSGANQTGSLPLGGATLTINTSSNSLSTFFSPLTGSGSVVINGTGTESLLGLNSFTGSTTVNGGTLIESYEAILGSNGAINVASGANLDAIANNNVSYAFTALTDNGGFIKDGTGTLTFSNHITNLNGNSFTVNNGAVVFDRTTDNATGLASGVALSVGSASIVLNGNATGASDQTFSSTALTGGTQFIVNSSGQNASITAGAITRTAGTGATINFALNSSGSGIASVSTTSTNNTYGILGGHATFGGTSWATSGTGTGPFTIAPLPAASYNANVFSGNSSNPTLHTDVTSSFTTTGTSAYTSDVRFNTPASATLNLNFNSSSNTIADGGILITPNVGANVTGIASPALTVGTNTFTSNASITAPANQDLFIQQYNTQANFNVSSVISNTAGTAVPVSGTSALFNTSATQTVTVASTAGLSIGELVTAKNSSNGTLLAASANAQVVAINSATSSVTIAYATAPTGNTSSGVAYTFTPETNVVKSGPGTLVLSGNNTFKGVLYLDQGTLVASVINNYGSTSSGTGSLYFNGGTLVANANFGPGSGLDQWFIGPAGATINAGNNIVITKVGNTLWGSGNITLTGTGTFDVGSSVSAFSGQIFDNTGIVQLTSNQLKNSTGITIGNGAEFKLSDTSSGPFNVAPGASLTLNGNGPGNAGAWLHVPDAGEKGSPNYAFNSAVILQSTSRFVEQGGYNNANTYITVTDTFPLPITGPGNLIKDGDGTLVLGNAYNTYGGTNGSTIISKGTLQLGVNGGVPAANTLQFGEAGSTNSGTFDMAGYNQSIAGLTTAGSGSAHQIINSNTSSQSVLTVNYNGATNQVFTSQIGGGTPSSPANNSIALVKAGTGTLSLLGTTTYTGGVTVSAGTLRVTGNAVSRPYTVSDGATLIVTNTDGTALPASTLSLGNSGTTNLDFEFNGAVPTSGAIAVSGTNGLTLNGTVNVAISSVGSLAQGQFPLITYTGALQGSGFAAINQAITLPSRVFGHLVNDTANDSIDLDITSIDFLKWSGAVSNNWDISTTKNFALNSTGSPSTYVDQPSPDSVVFDDTATGSHTVNLTTTLNPASVAVNTATSYTFSGPGSINGSTGLTVSGTGTLNVLTSNTYTGATTISSGTVVVGNGGTIGSLGSGNVTDNGLLVFNRSDNVSFNPNITGSGSLTTQGGGSVTLNGSLNIGGNVSIANGTLAVGAGVIGGNISGGGNLTKTGPGLMVVGGDVAVAGAVNISGGTLQIGNGGTTGTLANNVAVATAALLGFDRSDSYTYGGNIAGGGGVNVAMGTLKLTGSLTYTGPTTIGANTLDFGSPSESDLSGLITGTGNIIQDGTGLVKILNKDTGFTGNITINAGTMMLADEGARSALNAGLITINSGGRFIFGEGGILGENPDLPDTTFITIQPGGTFELRVGEQYGATQLQGGTLLINGFGAGQGITSNAVVGPFLGFDLQSGTVMATNVGTGAGTLTATNTGGSVTKSTPGTVNVIGPIAISSATPINITEGILSFQAIAMPTTGTAPLTIGGGPTTATLQLSDAGIASIARPVTLNSGASIDMPAVNGATGSLTISSAISGGGDLVLTGAGNLILSGSNNYSGNTNIAGGTLTLAATGFITNSPNITVNPGTTLSLLTSTSNTASGVVVKPLGNVNVSAGGLVTASAATNHANRLLLIPTTLSLSGTIGAWTSRLDLGSNDMDVPNGNLANLNDQVKQGYVGGFSNSSNGIISSAAANDSTHLTTLGVILNSANGTPAGAALYGGSNGQFDGTSPANTDVLIKYTYYGDTNLDGKVDASDYSRIDAGFLSNGSLTGWYNGDFNYDGVINGSDYTLIDNAFNSQGAILADQIATPTSEIAAGTSAVPEPATLGLLAIGSIGLLGRRRRA